MKVQKINQQNFKPFGYIIDYPKKRESGTKNLFKIIIRQPRNGWRIAYLVVRDKSISRLEQHPGSLESFEPVCGRGLLFVATRQDPKAINCFYLDKPVILKKGIWHGVLTRTRECDIKITENSKVKCVYWSLPSHLKTHG